MLHEIRNWWTDEVIYSKECETLKEAVAAAVADGASLDGASLDGARLTPIRDDVWAVLSASPREVPALREAIAGGRINQCAALFAFRDPRAEAEFGSSGGSLFSGDQNRRRAGDKSVQPPGPGVGR